KRVGRLRVRPFQWGRISRPCHRTNEELVLYSADMKERGLGFDADRALIHPLIASNVPSTEQALSMKLGWFTKRRGPEPSNDRELQRAGETVVVDVVQDGNSFVIEGDGIHIHYAVEGVELPRGADP